MEDEGKAQHATIYRDQFPLSWPLHEKSEHMAGSCCRFVNSSGWSLFGVSRHGDGGHGMTEGGCRV